MTDKRPKKTIETGVLLSSLSKTLLTVSGVILSVMVTTRFSLSSDFSGLNTILFFNSISLAVFFLGLSIIFSALNIYLYTYYYDSKNMNSHMLLDLASLLSILMGTIIFVGAVNSVI